MFGNLVYFNKKKIDQYSTLIRGKNAEINIKENDSEENKIATYLLECAEFEKLLQDREDYIDFVGETPDLSIKEVRISSIIKVTGEIYVPEQFDMIQLINEYKTYVMAGIDCKDQGERKIINQVFENSKMRIPIFCELGSECDYWLGISSCL